MYVCTYVSAIVAVHVKFSMERIAVIWSKKVIKCECWIGLPQTQCWVDPGGGPLPLPKGVAIPGAARG